MKQSRSMSEDGETAEPKVAIETPEHHVETAEEIYRSADADDPGRSPLPVYSVSAEAVHEVGARLARHPWATLAAGVLIGCLAGTFLRSRR